MSTRPRNSSRNSRASVAEALERRMLLSIQPVVPEFRVNTYSTNSQIEAAVALDGDGDFVVVWQSSGQDGSQYGVYAQLFNSSGVVQGGEFRVNAFTTFFQFNAAVAMDADGNFVVAWQSNVQDGSGDGIYAQRYDAAGVAQGAEFKVNTYTTSHQRSPTVAMDSAGNFVVAWHSYAQDGSGDGIYLQRYNAAGASQGAELKVNTYTTSQQRYSSVAMDADGNFVVAWQSNVQDGSGDGIYAQRYDAAGVAQGSEFKVNTYTTSDQRSPTVAMDSAGDFVVAWHSYAQDGSGDGIYAQRYNAAGASQGAELKVNTYTTNQQYYPSVAMDSDGDFVVAWHSLFQEGSYFEVYAQRYNRAGVTQGSEFRVNAYTPGSQAGAAVAMEANGDFVVAWHSYVQDGSVYGIYAQRYEVVPAVTASSFLFDTAPHKLRFTFDENVSASLGNNDLIVQNLTTSQTIPSSDLSITYDPNTNIATFSYTGSGGGQSGVLPDGNYRGTLVASGITTPNGTPLPGDYVLNFFFLNGDANHDRQVNLNDFNLLAVNFGLTPATFPQGDFNYDGTLDLNDFNLLAGRFGNVLAPDGIVEQRRGGRFSGQASPFADALIARESSEDDALEALMA